MPSEWTRDQREAAYQTYRSIQGKRSLRKTAELTGVPFGTLTDWSRQDGWTLRLRDDDDRDRAILRRNTEMRLVAEEDVLLDQLLYLSQEGTNQDKVKLEATKHALALLGVVPAERPGALPDQSQPRQHADIRSLSDAELRALERGQRE